jgi:hypothetical protein
MPRRTLHGLRQCPTAGEIDEAAELAALCGWENVLAKSSSTMANALQTPLGALRRQRL